MTPLPCDRRRAKIRRNLRALGRRDPPSRRRRLLVEMLEDRRLLTATPQGDDLRVNQVVNGVQRLSGGGDAVGIDAIGNFVVVYSSPGSNRTTDIFAQRFAANGVPLGSQVHVNQYVVGGQDSAAVAVRPDGQFVVVWAGKGASDSAGVFFRQFAADGSPLSGDQQANATTKDGQSQPAAAIGADGRFVIAWSGRNGRRQRCLLAAIQCRWHTRKRRDSRQ
jgi:putative extracellular protein